ncbi:hypothetical protein, partial [Aeromonas caviae]|uniref:hypothetical protein n=1 Tax=Aeromonas caviae TaxID=648 RepID=UPI001CC3E74C
VPDETVAVTLRVPPEFVRECRRVQMTPQELLRSFAGVLLVQVDSVHGVRSMQPRIGVFAFIAAVAAVAVC